MERQSVAKVQKPAARINHILRKPAGPSSLLHPLASLQHSIGNYALQRLIDSRFVQAKLEVSTPGDPFELEADRVADTVMRMPEPSAANEEGGKPNSDQHQEDEKEKSPEIQRVPLAVRDDEEEEEKVATKLEATTPPQQVNMEATASVQPIAEPPIQRQTKLDDDHADEEVSPTPLQRQLEDEEEKKETVQTKLLSSQLSNSLHVRSIRENANSSIQRLCTECEEAKPQDQGQSGEMVHRKSSPQQRRGDDAEDRLVQSASKVTTSVAANIHAMNSGGNALPDTTRAFFEPRFGADFSQVRVHTDARAAGTAKSVNAKAFTVGRSIAFGAGQFAPESHEGKRLLAHELTHVLQQGARQSQRVPTPAKDRAVAGRVQSQKPTVHFRSTSVQRQDDAPDHLATLKEMLDRTNVPEEEVLALLPQLTAAEKASVTTDAYYKNGMASAFNTGEMVKAVRILGLSLEKQLEWIEAATSPSNIDYSEIQALITAAQQADRDKLKTNRWRDFFVGVCDNSTIITAVTDLKFDLVTQLEWIEEEASPKNLDYSDIQALITAAQQSERDKLKTDRWRDFFVGVCTNKTIIPAVTDLKFDLVTQLEWIEEEASPSNLDYSDIQPLITPAPQADRDKLKTTRWRDFFVGVCTNKTIIPAVTDLKFDLVTQLEWIEEEASPKNLDYSDIQPLIAPAPQADKDKLKTTGWRDFFVGVCTNATIMNALDDLKFDLTTTIQWLLEEASVSNVDFTWLCSRFKAVNVFPPGEDTIACTIMERDIRDSTFNTTPEHTPAGWITAAHNQLLVANQMAGMVGDTAKWRGSGPGSGTTFEKWASAAVQGPVPALGLLTVINCWEMIMLAAFKSGALSWTKIHSIYSSGVPNWNAFLVNQLSFSNRICFNPPSSRPIVGDIVFFDGAAHVALGKGSLDGAGRTEIYSFWPPPNTKFTAGGTIDQVKVTTIEELNDYWVGHGKPAFKIEYATPNWS